MIKLKTLLYLYMILFNEHVCLGDDSIYSILQVSDLQIQSRATTTRVGLLELDKCERKGVHVGEGVK